MFNENKGSDKNRSGRGGGGKNKQKVTRKNQKTKKPSGKPNKKTIFRDSSNL